MLYTSEEEGNMIRCPKCNEELEDDAVFCSGCGAPIEQTIFCPQCGEKTSRDSAFCQNCGAPINHIPEMKAPSQAAASAAAYNAAPAMGQPAAAPAAKSKGLKLNPVIIAGIGGVALIAVVVIVIALVLGNRKSEDNYVLYVKDQEIMYSDLGKKSTGWQVTSRLVDTNSIDDDDLAYAASTLGSYTYITDNEKYIFFIDKLDDSDDGFNLYYRRLGKNDEPIKIDSGVTSYTVDDSVKLVTYLKGGDGNLYQYSLSADDKEKIASDVTSFAVSDDGSVFYYLTEDGDLYWASGEEKEKLAGEISSWEYTDDDFEYVYYIKDEALYRQGVAEEREKIASDVADVLKIYDSGEVYYTKSASETGTLMDYVTDDMKESDAAMTEPEYPSIPDRPSYWSDEYDAWAAQRDQLLADYNAAMEEYYAKENRDYIREELESMEPWTTVYSLCYYDGAEETMLSETFSGSSSTVAGKSAVITYESYVQEGMEKVKLSEITDAYDVQSKVEETFSESKARYIAVKGVPTEVEQEKAAGNFRISSDGSVVYYIDDIPDEKDYGDLYKIAIKDGAVGDAEVYDTDVYNGSISIIDDTKVRYYKDYDTSDGEGELYIDKTKIDYDVYACKYDSDTDTAYYITDWDSDKGYGTLNIYKKGESEKVADDVSSYVWIDDGRILYLTDYSLSHYKGDLMVWDDGDTRKLDEDVVCIIPIYTSQYRD